MNELLDIITQASHDCIGDPRLLDKARAKLAEMSPISRYRLIDSLPYQPNWNARYKQAVDHLMEPLIEKWEATIKCWNKPVDIFLNPSKAEWSRLFRKYPKGLRGHILRKNGDLIVWDSDVATHNDVEQHYPEIMAGHRYFFQDHIELGIFNINPSITNEYTTTVSNISVKSFYGNNPKVIIVDSDGRYDYDEWSGKNKKKGWFSFLHS